MLTPTLGAINIYLKFSHITLFVSVKKISNHQYGDMKNNMNITRMPRMSLPRVNLVKGRKFNCNETQ